jgi:hypothetical protein
MSFPDNVTIPVLVDAHLGDMIYFDGINWINVPAGIPFGATGIPTGRTATYVIAASDAPAHVRAQADYVVGVFGTADQIIADIFSKLPTYTYTRSGDGATGTGKIGSIHFSNGRFTFANQWNVPLGADIALSGSSPSPLAAGQPLTGVMPYLGGTEFYFTSEDATYPVFNAPADGGYSTIALDITNIVFVVKNPLAKQANTVYAINLDGWTGGSFKNVVFTSDALGWGNSSVNIKGVSIKSSWTHDDINIESMTVCSFLGYALTLQCDHLRIGSLIVSGTVAAAVGDLVYGLEVIGNPVSIQRFASFANTNGVHTAGPWGSTAMVDIGTMVVEGTHTAIVTANGAKVHIGNLDKRNDTLIPSATWLNATIDYVTYDEISTVLNYGGRVNSSQGYGIGGKHIVNRLLPILGDVRGLWPLFDVAASTVVTDYSPKGHNGVASKNTNAFTTPSYTKGASVMAFINGSVHGDYVTVADHADFAFGDNSTDSAFSVITVLRAAAWTNWDYVLMKGLSAGTGNSEWGLTTVSGRLYFTLNDPSASALISRYANAAVLSVDTTYIVIATYDGSGTIAGIKIHINGVRADDTDSVVGTYVAMENTNAPITIGGETGGNTAFDGQMSWVGITAKELTVNDVWNVTQIVKESLELP